MIIGLVLNSAPGYSETFFRNKIRLLTEAGIKVIVFVDSANEAQTDYSLVAGFRWEGDWQTKARDAGFALMRLLKSPLKALKLFRENKQTGFSNRKNCLSLLTSAHILGYKLDWIHFGFATVALGRENLGKVLSARTAVSIRGYDIAVYPRKYPNCYQLLWAKTNKLHHLSDELYLLAAEQGIPDKLLHKKITPAVDTSKFQGQKFSSLSEPLKIVTVARLHWIRGLDYVLTALSLIAKRGIDFQYTVIGEGRDYERLVFASHQLGIKEKVKFLGKKKPSEITEILQESDIYLQYSNHEGFCNSVIEAQSMGLLCIGSDGGALPENILHEKTGWIVPKRNPHALAEQIIKIINFPESKLRQISGSAIDRVKTEFTLQKQKSEFIKFYQ